MNNKSDLLLSVCMITYNHETYIKQAIESVLMQLCSFSIELVIGEDCSTDNTLKICSDFAKSNPCIRLISNSSNQGMMRNFERTLTACHGKYIAICEGDDYWTDPYKLQKQVDYLERHPEVSLCFTNSKILNDITKEFKNWTVFLTTKYYEAKEIMFDLVIPTCSVVIRNQMDDNIRNRLLNRNYIMGDLILWLSIAEYGKLFCINEQMVVYRKNQTSFAFRLPLEKQIQLIHQHEEIAKDFNCQYALLERKFLSRQYMVIGFKCLIAFDKRTLNFIKLSFTMQPGRLPANILYLIKRIFITDRAV